MLRQFCFRFSRRAAKQIVEGAVRHRQAGHEIEGAKIQPKRTIRLEIDELIENAIAEFRFAVRRQAHHFVFTGVDAKPQVIGERGIEQA